MKIRRLEVRDFRSLRKVDWEPGDLNLVIGPNGSGKSNLLQALDLLSASARAELSDYIRRAGGMAPLVWDGEAPGIAFRVDVAPLIVEKSIERDSLGYAIVLERLGV